MDKVKIAESLAYLDFLAGLLHPLTKSTMKINGIPTVQCNPEAFIEMKKNLHDVTKVLREEIFGEEPE